MRKFFSFLLVFSCCALAHGQEKIAIIDLKKVFDSYYKTKQADTQLKDRAADFQKTGRGMLEDYQKANEEYKKMLESANDQAVSTEERDKRKKSAETKLRELQEIEQNVTQFNNQSKTLLGEQQRRARDNILREIREMITSKAKTAGFTMVLDTAAETINNTPMLLYTNGENDMTDSVLKQLNAAAPPELLHRDDPKDKPPLDKKDKDKK
jgi:outer membrane protein